MYGAFFVYFSLTYYIMILVIGDPICNDYFGRPTYNDCEELATELSGGWPGEEPRPDRRLHLFSVPDAVIPSWVTPHSRNRRVTLPKLATEGPGCKMSLMPLRQSNGEVSVDVGYYYSMSRPGQELNFDCVRSEGQGGFTHVGTTRSLILTFYAPDSPFDEAVQQWIENDQASCQGTAAAVPTSKDAQEKSCKDDDEEFLTFLNDIGDFSAVEEPKAPVAPAPPTCGEYCSGPANLCGASDGCRCIADSFQGIGSRYYTGTCKPSSFAFDGRRLQENLVNGTNLVQVTSNFTLTVNGSAGVQAVDSPPACPCNCTYVSVACCDAPSGVVYEAADLKLGVLEPWQCPNSTNGTRQSSHP